MVVAECQRCATQFDISFSLLLRKEPFIHLRSFILQNKQKKATLFVFIDPKKEILILYINRMSQVWVFFLLDAALYFYFIAALQYWLSLYYTQCVLHTFSGMVGYFINKELSEEKQLAKS